MTGRHGSSRGRPGSGREPASSSTPRLSSRQQAQRPLRSSGRSQGLNEVLTSALALPPFTFERLMTFPGTPRFDPGPLGHGLPAPDWSSFEPQRPRGLRRFLGGAARYRRQLAEAEILFADAVSDHQQKERQRQRALAAAKARHDQNVTEQRGQVAAGNAHISRRESTFAAGNAEAVTWFAGRVLDASRYPDGFPREYQVSYRPGSRDVVVEFELPRGMSYRRRGRTATSRRVTSSSRCRVRKMRSGSVTGGSYPVSRYGRCTRSSAPPRPVWSRRSSSTGTSPPSTTRPGKPSVLPCSACLRSDPHSRNWSWPPSSRPLAWRG